MGNLGINFFSFVAACSTCATPQNVPYKNWGIANNEARSHVMALDAWTITEGNKDIVVAVIDTGLDATHPDLAQNLWHDPAMPSVYGWNFINNKPNPIDEHGHGTHVAGIIGAVSDPKTGISGVAHRVKIMPIKYYSDANPGSVNLRNTVQAFNYAIEHGAKIINYSGGGPEFSEYEYLAIKRAESKGILVIAAAGNEHENTDLPENKYYPAAYGLSNMVTVASADIHNNLLAGSNYGKKSVDLSAPGENIYSTLPGDRFGYMSGTSMAAPFVTGTAVLLLACNPKLTPIQLKELMMNSVDKFPQQKEKTKTGGRVNAYAALLLAKQKYGKCVMKYNSR